MTRGRAARYQPFLPTSAKAIRLIPEIELFAHGLVRIPPEMDVPLSERVRRILDTPVMRRLADISQLGLVHLVYPGARHSRLEHSLGVYRNALQVVRTLARNSRFRALVDAVGAEAFVLAALLHDAGHWPFCHPMEDMRLASIPNHESRVAKLVETGPVADLIARDWDCTGSDVMSILAGKRIGKTSLSADAIEFLASCLSGPVDVDKLDYLVRDSLHAGVPYGRNFDASRLLASLTVHPHKPRLAITDKGRTAAEMMVFARYIMFSEVYWHHAVRSASAMLQRLVFELQTVIDVKATLDDDEPSWVDAIRSAAAGTVAMTLADGLFGPTRRLYKQVAQFNLLDRPDLHRRLAHRPYWWLVASGDELARSLSRRLGKTVRGMDVLIDAPPVKLEVDINMDVVGSDGQVRKLGDVSPVADSLARQQFDGHVKRVRVFVCPDLRQPISECLKDDSCFSDVIDTVNREVV